MQTPALSGWRLEYCPHRSLPGAVCSRQYILTKTPLCVGRDLSCDIQLQGTSVSRRHAQLSQEKEGWVLSDSSSNGTFVNGERVEGEVLVRAGDVISFSGLPVDADAEAGEVAEQGLTSPFVFVLAYQGAEMGDSKAKEEGESSSRCS